MLTRRLFLTTSSSMAGAAAALAVPAIAAEAPAATPEPAADAELLRLFRAWLQHLPIVVDAGRAYEQSHKQAQREIDALPIPWRLLHCEPRRKGEPIRVREFRNRSQCWSVSEYHPDQSEVRVVDYPEARDGRHARKLSKARERREIEERERAIHETHERVSAPPSRAMYGLDGDGAYHADQKLREAISRARAETLVGVAIKVAACPRYYGHPAGDELAAEGMAERMGLDLVEYGRSLQADATTA